MPDQTDSLKNILLPLNNLLAANDRLGAALNATEKQWPYVTDCWIDQMSEPTKLLAQHRLKRCGSGGSGSGFVPSGGQITVASVSS